ncbi:MAG TPA: hypothetical protein VHJ82_04710 [Actinomycetota bacterium]|nr:hypothetical protein [Actinomycetota bacterium]
MTHEKKLRRTSLFLALVLSSGVGIACDREDVRDVEETINDVEEDAEQFGEEVEEQIDDMDTDGKDD